MTLSTAQKLVCLFALTTVSSVALAQRSSDLSVDLPNSRTMAVQDKVDAIFDAGDFDRAFFIYRNELAPLGDKYAQYMVGFMYMTGLGVSENAVMASAWYRLAAERGTPEFQAVRDRLLQKLDEDELRRSDELFAELRRSHSDLAVLLSSIKRDYEDLAERTGTRLGGESSAVMVIEPRAGRVTSGGDYFNAVRKQLADRIALLKEVGQFEDLDPDPGKVNLRELERLVEARIAAGE
jgi:hypothetical protein